MEYYYFTILSINTLLENGNIVARARQYIHSEAKVRKVDNNVSNNWYLEGRGWGWGENEMEIFNSVQVGDH